MASLENIENCALCTVVHNVEIPAHLWTHLRLTTVSEELAQRKTNLRCRIESFWTLPAKALAVLAFVVVLALVTLFARELPWIWLLLTALPLVCWMLDDERLAQERALTALIESTAKDKSLTRLGSP